MHRWHVAGFRGIQIGTNVNGLNLDDERLLPVFAVRNRLVTWNHSALFISVCVPQRWNGVRICDPVTRPDPTRLLSVVKQILVNGLIAVSVTCHTPFTRYNRLSTRLYNRIDNRLYTRYSWLSNRLSNGLDNRLNVCIYDTTGCQTGLRTGFATGCIV